METVSMERTPIKVFLHCTRDTVPESTVKITNVEEDIQGRDVVTFDCPVCGREHQSLRFG